MDAVRISTRRELSTLQIEQSFRPLSSYKSKQKKTASRTVALFAIAGPDYACYRRVRVQPDTDDSDRKVEPVERRTVGRVVVNATTPEGCPLHPDQPDADCPDCAKLVVRHG